MEPRKLVKAGASSLVVSLPRNWVKRGGLSAGNIVYISEQTDGSIRITSGEVKEVKESEITIETRNKSMETIKREITSAYLKNHNTIHIVGEGITKHHLEIRQVIHDFVAFEITEQTGSRLTAKDLLNREEVSIDKTLRRMDMTVRAMLADIFKEPISIRDHDVNRMYFLINKLLKQAVIDNTTAKQINVAPDEILVTWDMCTMLESIADDAVELAKIKKTKTLSETSGKLRKQYEQAVHAYFAKDLKEAEAVVQTRQDLLSEFKKLPAGAKEIATNMLNNVTKIARIAMDR